MDISDLQSVVCLFGYIFSYPDTTFFGNKLEFPYE